MPPPPGWDDLMCSKILHRNKKKLNTTSSSHPLTLSPSLPLTLSPSLPLTLSPSHLSIHTFTNPFLHPPLSLLPSFSLLSLALLTPSGLLSTKKLLPVKKLQTFCCILPPLLFYTTQCRPTYTRPLKNNEKRKGYLKLFQSFNA